jgi:Cft2 family RNA processing exonuclease
MKLRILGCSGGIGGRHLRTTSMLLDRDILIDAGTGVGDLSLPELAAIDHVFLTHSHLDHICCLPLLVDTVGDMRGRPLTVHLTEATLAILKNHVFNWAVWPDFSEIPDAQNPYLQFHTIRVGEPVQLDGRTITPLPAEHTVPAVGYLLDSGSASLAFTGDTGPNPALWPILNGVANLRTLIVETAFSNRERELALLSKHLCPSLLREELNQFTGNAEIFITHLKPGQIELTMHEIDETVGHLGPKMLQNNQTFEL